MNYTKHEMLNKALEAFGDLGDDEELGPADWPTVKRYITSLNDVGGEPVHPHTSSENGDNVDHMHLKDIRVRLLNGENVTSQFWGKYILFVICSVSFGLFASIIVCFAAWSLISSGMSTSSDSCLKSYSLCSKMLVFNLDCCFEKC